jgi:hypothetical protein
MSHRSLYQPFVYKKNRLWLIIVLVAVRLLQSNYFRIQNMQSSNLSTPSAFIIKSNFFPILILQLLTIDVDLFRVQLDNLLATQKFSKNSLIILDLQKTTAETGVPFILFREILHSKNLILVGIIGGNEQQKEEATNVRLHIFLTPQELKNKIKVKNEQPTPCLPAELITYLLLVN